jgi:hypothetical protein
VVNTAICPTLSYTPTSNSIAYTGSVVAGTADYTVQLWNSTGLVLISSNTTTLTAPATLAGSFTSLTPSTTYKVRVVVNLGETSEVVCSFTVVQTLPETCLPAINVTSELNLPIL